MCLTAETINGTILSAELASNPQGQGEAVLPEELGQNCAKLLLEEVYRVSFVCIAVREEGDNILVKEEVVWGTLRQAQIQIDK